MKIQNLFFAACVSMMVVSPMHSMLVTTQRVPCLTSQSLKKYKSFQIPIGNSSLTFHGDEIPVRIQEIYDEIKDISAMKCANKYLTDPGINGDVCSSDICCGRAFFLAMQKNIQAQQEMNAIKDRFLKSLGKKGRCVYLEDIKEKYIQLAKYRVLLNEFCGNAYQQERLKLYVMINNINVCLFNQAQVIIEDSFERWKQDNFKMTPEIESVRSIRADINEWHKNEQEYSDEIVDEQSKANYKRIALVRNGITTYKLSRIDEEYKLLHGSDKQTRE